MKKIFLTLLAIFSLFQLANKVDASEGVVNNDYVNLLSPDTLVYDEATGKISSNKYIHLKALEYYTFVATVDFFGTTCEDKKTALVGKKPGTLVLDENKQMLNYTTVFVRDHIRLYYIEFRFAKDCDILFTDLLVQGRTLDNLLKDNYIFYQGNRYDFQGFKKVNTLGDDYCSVGDEIDIYTDYDNPIDIATITDNLVLFDADEGILSNDCLNVIDNYSGNQTVGKHEVLVEAKDKKNNTRLLKVYIHVVDKRPPVITGPAVIHWQMSSPCPTIADLYDQFTVTDNADGTIASENMFIESSTLSSYELGVKKEYIVTLGVKDQSNNLGTCSVIVSTVDTEPPVLVVKDLTIKLSEMGDYAFNNLYSKPIVEMSDNSGKHSLSYSISEMYGHSGFSGEFTYTYTLKDPSGNSTTKTAKITIIDDIAPEIYIKSFILETTTANPYSAESLKKAIRHELDTKGILYDDINLISSNYFNQEKEIGTYQVKYTYSYNGDTSYEIATINVSKAKGFNYAWLCLLLIPAAGVSAWLFFKKRKNT